MNVALWLERAARVRPQAPALFLGKTLIADYSVFSQRAASIAEGLRSLYSIKPGDRVGLFLPNHIDYLPLLFGIWWAGAVAVPINAKLHPQEAAWILSDAGATVVFIGSTLNDFPEGLRDEDLPFTQIAVESSSFTDIIESVALEEPEVRADNDLAWLFYTSGTTGRPKGTMLSHGNLAAMTHAYLVDVDQPAEGEAYFYAAPMSHGAGLYSLVHVLRANAHVVSKSKGFDPAELFDLAEHFRHLSLFAVPTMVKRLIEHADVTGSDVQGLITVVYGGGPMYLADIENAVAKLGSRFIQIYGQGETPMTISTLSRATVADRTDGWRERLASVGHAFSCVEIRIADQTGHPLPCNQIGEILVRGPTVMQGYWNNDEASSKALRGGWLWTGDMGAMSEDGYLTLKDRSKDVIISGGTNIYPREVEEALLMHPDVTEVCVIGRPDPEWGEEVLAYVVARPGSLLDPPNLDRHCLERIARFKRPKHYRFVEVLPKSDYGKILKTALREQLEAEMEVTNG